MNRALVVLVLFLSPLAGAAQDIGTFTLIEGAPRVIRGASVLRAAEGMRFQTGDIIETSTPGFVQAELSGGAILAVGPATRVWVHSPGGKDVLLMTGWLKGEIPAAAGAYRFSSPLLSASSKTGSVILHAAPVGAELFVEAGSATIGDAAGRGQSAKSGQFFTHRPPKPVAAASRPDGLFLESMPQPFRDTLPSRLSYFNGKKAPEAKRDHDVSFAEVEPWLKMSGGRRAFAERFQVRLRDAEFRRAVEPHLAEYPEWDRVLHPEKYQQNSPAAPAETAKTPSGRD